MGHISICSALSVLRRYCECSDKIADFILIIMYGVTKSIGIDMSVIFIIIILMMCEMKRRSDTTAIKVFDTIKIPYSMNGVRYKLLIRSDRVRPAGWCRVDAIISDGESVDVTNEVTELAGPLKDFFGMPCSTQLIHPFATEVVFHYDAGNEVTFSDDIDGLKLH